MERELIMKRKKILIAEALVLSLLVMSSITTLGLNQNNIREKKERNCSICPLKGIEIINSHINRLSISSIKFTPSIGLMFLCGIFCFIFSYLPCMAVNGDSDKCGAELAYCSLSCAGLVP